MSLAGSTTESLTRFFHQGSSIEKKAHEVVYDSGMKEQSIFCLESGYVKSYTISNDGRTNIRNLYAPDAIFPLVPVFRRSRGNQAYRSWGTVYFETITDCILYKHRMADFIEFIEKYPEVYRDLVYHLIRNLDMHIYGTEVVRLRSARRRVIHQLLVLAARFGAETKDGVVIEIPLTHRDLSDTMSMARETVTREMEILRREGYIAPKGQRITVSDIGALREELIDM